MRIGEFTPAHKAKVIELYAQVFSDSEGRAEGQLIGDLVEKMIDTSPEADLMGFIAQTDSAIVGCILFSRMEVPSGQEAFILSPVAVHTDMQRQGLGLQLIRHGLDALDRRGVELVFTYGDPNYYGKVGFKHLSESVVQAPCKLSQPQGWLAQSLIGNSIQPMRGKAKCIDALSDPQYW